MPDRARPCTIRTIEKEAFALNNPETALRVGLTHEITVRVTTEMTAAAMKSGLLSVLATPILIACMENVCYECVAPHLAPGHTTVGTRVEVAHTAASAVGAQVRFTGTLTEADGRRLVFAVEAFEGGLSVGKGTHERFVIDAARFMDKLAARQGV